MWLAALANALAPVLVNLLQKLIDRGVKKLETSSAVKSAKTAKTIEDFKSASVRLSNASSRPSV